MGPEGCRGDPPRDSLDAAMGVRANLMPPGMRSTTHNPMLCITHLVCAVLNDLVIKMLALDMLRIVLQQLPGWQCLYKWALQTVDRHVPSDKIAFCKLAGSWCDSKVAS